MKFFSTICSLFLCLIIFGACEPDVPVEIVQAMKNLPEEIDYNLHVKPILSDKCFACHGPDEANQKAGLRLDLAESAYGELPETPGKFAINPGSIGGSEIFWRITSTDPDVVMPAPESHLSLSDYEKAVLVKWIEEGAEYKRHWAFVKPEPSPIPTVQQEGWTKNPIDNYILAKLEKMKLSPAKRTDKETLLRRVTLDLTGLPPTLEEIDNFVRDESADAYQKVVDRLLASAHYGEKMAVAWLDVARFADTHGYTVDRPRDMSPYRDWVIKSFNENQRYDEFVHWQLAGDLMPNPTKEMLIATAFNRNHPQNMEGGIIEKEFQAEYVIDRTNTLGDALMGISLGCARCHDHKYDPVSQKNYYELFSFFNNVREAGQISWNNALPTPTLMLPTEEQEKLIAYIENNIAQKQLALKDTQLNEADFTVWLKTKNYQDLAKQEVPSRNLEAKFGFDKSGLASEVNPNDKSFTTLQANRREKEVFTAGKHGKGIKLNGDAWLECGSVGVFRKSEPFTIGMAVNIPKEVKEGVIFHKSLAERLYNFRGFHVYIRDNGTVEASMAHTAPSNAIMMVSKQQLPRDKWIHLTLSYDGSSKAEGFNLYLDGKPLEMITEVDQLTKDILFNTKKEPGLQVGAWERGYGLKNGIIDDIAVYDRMLTPFEIAVLAGQTHWKEITDKDLNELSTIDKDRLKDYYFSAVHPASLTQQAALQKERTRLADSVENIREIMVMQEMDEPKQSYILERGIYDALGEKVYPNTPERIFPFNEALPKNRYGLALWLTDPDNPLTARVAVNRFWQNIFGTGLVKSAEDFGNQGELPSNLKLLDFLAIQFVESGWNVKELIKMMVMTATYQQESIPTQEKLDKDYENRFLSRGPSKRLTAEMIRDNALAASGLMNDKIGGPSVKPYQPDGLWEINGAKYVPDSNDAVYRRSVYVFVKRSVPNPTLATFDATSRSVCTVRRQGTNTPLQALVTLNDPTFVESSKVLGEQMANERDTAKAIEKVYRKLTGKMPKMEEIQLLLQLRDHELDKFKNDPAKTKGWLEAGYYEIDPSLDAATVAANAVVASTILNSDAVITKR